MTDSPTDLIQHHPRSLEHHMALNAQQSSPARRFTPEIAVQTMRAAGYEPLEPYTSARVPWRCRCNHCGRERTPRYNAVQQGSRCPCHTRVPHDQAVADMLAVGYEPLEPYTEADAPWRCRCTSCGQIRTPRRTNALKGHRCPCRQPRPRSTRKAAA